MKTELCIIGTVHHDTEKYTGEDLLTILKIIKPNVLLEELYSKHFDENYNLTMDSKELSKWQELKTSLEYKIIDSNILFRPFDLEGRNELYKEVGYSDIQSGVDNAMKELYKKNKLSDECKFYYELMQNLFEVKLKMAYESPLVVNSAMSRSLIAVEHNYWFKCTEKIIELTPELSAYSNFKKSVSDIWIKRNNVMVQNILNWINEFSGKKLVVLVGAEHKNYLYKNLIDRQESNQFILKEFWEY